MSSASMSIVARVLGVIICFSLVATWSADSTAQSDPDPTLSVKPRPPRGAAAAIPAELPIPNPNTPLGAQISEQCGALSDQTELIVPGPKGDIKLHKCYHGRAHLSCELNVLMTEAKSLVTTYGRILNADYPNVPDIARMCKINANTLADDIQRSNEFTERYRSLRAEYGVRAACAMNVAQSLQQMSLIELHQAQSLSKSILDSIDIELGSVSITQAKLSDFADRMALSNRALDMLQKMHRAVCLHDQQMSDAGGLIKTVPFEQRFSVPAR